MDTTSATSPGIMRWFVDRYGGRIRDLFNRFVVRYSEIENCPVFDRHAFSWVQPLEAEWTNIRAEALQVLRNPSVIPPLGEISPDHRRLDQKRSWRTYFLWGYGVRADANCTHCPETARLVEKIPGLVSAMFSLHHPGTHLPRHRGVTKGMITCHLPLVVPRGAGCRIDVEDETYYWQPGEMFLFDDTYHHEVWNEAEEDRIILLLHIRRPLRAPGRWAQNCFFRLIRNSPFVKDVERNLALWDERLTTAMQQGIKLPDGVD